MKIEANLRPIAVGVVCAALLAGVGAVSLALAGQEAPADAQAAAGDAPDPQLIARGKRLYVFCQACHATEAVPGSKIGPHLGGIVNRPAASVEDWVYSDALRSADFVWSEENLDVWLQRPADLVPGTNMSFAGLPRKEIRAALIAYLRTL